VQCFRDDFDACIAHLRFPLRSAARMTAAYMSFSTGRSPKAEVRPMPVFHVRCAAAR